MKDSRVSVCVMIPVFNEEDAVPHLIPRVSAVIDGLPDYSINVLFVNDGSTDRTLQAIEQAGATVSYQIRVADLSRNHGKEIAMAAGFDLAESDALIVMDADLQDPPELIPEMIRIWRETGADDVYAQREHRHGERLWKRLSSSLYYRILQRFARVQIQVDTGDFRLLSRRAVLALREFRESQRYTKGLFSLVGLRKVPIQYDRDPRIAGSTKWRVGSLVNLAIEGITSFSVSPLRFATKAGATIALLAITYTAYIVIRTIVRGVDVPGYASLMSVMLFLGAAQLLAIGMIGEYIGRIFMETKRRPLYQLNDTIAISQVENREAP